MRIDTSGALNWEFDQGKLSILAANQHCYWPNSSQGSPAISPGFDAFWNQTGSAVRVVSRLNKFYNTSTQDVTITSSVVGDRYLLRQFIFPFRGSGIFSRQDLPTGLIAFHAACKGKVSNAADAQLDPWLMVRLVNSSGTTISANTNLGTVIVSNSLGLGLLTSEVGNIFSPSDVGRYFFIENAANRILGLVSPDVASINTISNYVSATQVRCTYQYTGTSSLGTGRTIRYLEAYEPCVLIGTSIASTSLTDISFGAGGGMFSPQGLSPNIWERYYLVMEVGFVRNGAASMGVNRDFTMRFGGDSTDDIIGDGGSSPGMQLGYTISPSQIAFSP